MIDPDPDSTSADAEPGAPPADKVRARSIRRATQARLSRLVAFSLALILCTGVIVALAIEAQNKINALNTANSDNVQWTLSQSEVEFLMFHSALMQAQAVPDPDTAPLRKWFDVFYSRIDTLHQSPLYAELTHLPRLVDPFARIAAFLNDTARLIDGPDADLVADLPALAARADALRADVRAISLEGINTFAHQSDVQREGVSNAMTRIAALTGGLVIALLVLVFFLIRLSRITIGQARDNQLTGDRLDAMLRTSLDAILVVDRSGRFVEFNGAAEKIFGYSKEDAVGSCMTDLIFPSHLIAAHAAGMANYLKTGQQRFIGQGRVQLEARRRSGEVFPVELSIARTNAPDGEIFVSFLRDISERVAAEDKLITALIDAQAGERAKTHFLAVMSHEMRTPLNGLLGTLDLMNGTALSDKQAEYLAIMQTSGRLLLHHVNDVLDIAKLEAGKTGADKQSFELENLVAEVLDGLRPLAQARGNTLTLDPGRAPIGTVQGDPQALRQVLLNLASNAIKFTFNGSVNVGLAQLQSQNADTLVEFTIADTGLGIAPDDLDRIFEDFVTLDGSYGRRAEGTGLGLGIARRLTGVMGGQIGAESELGEGSLFWVRLPFSVPATTKVDAPRIQPPQDAPRPRPCSVLVVEDNAINRFIVREMLLADGHHVTEANDGDDGVRAAQATRFDLILMDVSMPRLNGIEATQQIRAGQGASAKTTILALTAHALPADKARFLQAGMNGSLTKPLQTDALRAIMQETLGDQWLISAPGPYASAAGPDDPLIAPAVLADLRDSLGPAIAQSLLTRFHRELDAALLDIGGVIHARDAAAATAALHRMAGSAATFGAHRLLNLLFRMEQQSKEGALDQVEQALPALYQLWAETRNAMVALQLKTTPRPSKTSPAPRSRLHAGPRPQPAAPSPPTKHLAPETE